MSEEETQVETPPRKMNPFMPGTSPVRPTEPPPQEDAPKHVDAPDLEHLRANEALAASMRLKLAVLESGVDFEAPAGKLLLRALKSSESWKDSSATAEEIRSTAEAYDVPMKWEPKQ